MEGCSKEVFALKNHFRRSCVIGLSRFYEMKVSLRERCYGMNFRWYPLFRLLAPFCERRSKINHIYGSLAEWFFLHTLRQRPIVITIASPDAPLARPMYRRVRRFVAQSNPTVAELRGWGFDPETVRLIYPGIDLNRYHPAPRAPGRKFRVLFATSPNSDEGFVNRGVALMLEAAARLPDVEFHLLWRPWGDDPTAQRLEGKEAPNVIVSRNVIGNMTDVFHAADATIAPFVRNHESRRRRRDTGRTVRRGL
jgi:glycosyltransferase involved in cell wall biosynthesis